MQVLVNRISGERDTRKTAFNYYKDTLLECGVSETEIFCMKDLNDLADKLNELDIYGCGNCFSVENVY